MERETLPEALPTAAEALEGIDLPGGWRVGPLMPRENDATGGHFSRSYFATRSDGTKAFVKALDYSAALAAPSPAIELRNMTSAYVFECDVLDRCSSARMSHVVLALAHGEVEVSGFGVLSRVNYILFECAEHDIRKHRDLLEAFDEAWALRALHNVAIGLRQLHAQGIAHQDIKPSNILVFSGQLSKIGDFGRAAMRGTIAPHEGLALAGDATYAPPELLYRWVDPDADRRRRACDCYHLASLMLFLFNGVGTTGALAAELAAEHHWRRWGGTYSEVLPFVLDAWERIVGQLAETAPPVVRDRVVRLYREMSDPDPARRGDTINRRIGLDPYNLERAVSALDLSSQLAEMALRRRMVP